jgi:hypothetical protein
MTPIRMIESDGERRPTWIAVSRVLDLCRVELEAATDAAVALAERHLLPGAHRPPVDPRRLVSRSTR